MQLGQFEAGRLRADLGERTVVLDRRRSLENRPRGGQMMDMRRFGTILASPCIGGRRRQPRRWRSRSEPVSALKGHDSNAPVDVAADRIEVQDRADRAIFAGNVNVRQAELTLDTERLTVAYSSSGGVQIRRLDAAGGVVVRSPSETARGNFGIYDLDRKLITLIGNVQLDAAARRSTARGWSSTSTRAAR